MGSRGRTSAAALAAQLPSNVVSVAGPDRIPRGLSAREAEIWREIMDGPCGEIIQPEAYPLLREYVALAADHEKVSAASQRLTVEEIGTSEGLELYERLAKRRETIGRGIASLAVKLRLAPSARVHKERAATIAAKPRGRKPWEED